MPNEFQVKRPNNGWMGRPVVHVSHVADLEARSAIHEFGNRMPREHAENRAYEDYKREQALISAAHHLMGLRAAHAGGAEEAAKEHGYHYVESMKAMGADPYAPPPPELLNHIKANPPDVYMFKGHPTDALRPPKEEPVKEVMSDSKIQDSLEKLKSLRHALATGQTQEE